MKYYDIEQLCDELDADDIYSGKYSECYSTVSFKESYAHGIPMYVIRRYTAEGAFEKYKISTFIIEGTNGVRRRWGLN